MAQMPREPEAFAEQVARLFQRHFPERKAELVGPFEMVINGKRLALENLYRMVQFDPERGVEIVEDYLDHLVEGDALNTVPMPLAVAKPRVMPRIQPISIFQHLDPQNVAHTSYVNETVIVYVIDLPHLTVSITTEQMIKWGVDAEDLDRIARENLSRYAPDLQIQIINSNEGGKAAVFARQDGYDAARLLLDRLHARLAPELGGDFYVATPARDMFLAMSIGPDPFIERIRGRVKVDYRRLPYPITSDLFVVTRDGVAGTMAA